MTLKVLLTGGTIDKYYNPLKGELAFHQTCIPAALARGNCQLEMDIQTLFLKDSLDMDDADREHIRQACLASTQAQIVITHGTDTMADTARHLLQTPLPKTIVLTGAMIPLSIHGSDGLFNLGAAVMAAQCLPHGVYVAMNGRVFEGASVVKNRGLGLFEVSGG